mmetsp:Transcript_21411/g.75385  ORF Transcript_21411/g.75385 Transcript_21411/m.75385 type:complete len:213 (-) Transcript_21411:599-1237(-)
MPAVAPNTDSAMPTAVGDMPRPSRPTDSAVNRMLSTRMPPLQKLLIMYRMVVRRMSGSLTRTRSPWHQLSCLDAPAAAFAARRAVVFAGSFISFHAQRKATSSGGDMTKQGSEYSRYSGGPGGAASDRIPDRAELSTRLSENDAPKYPKPSASVVESSMTSLRYALMTGMFELNEPSIARFASATQNVGLRPKSSSNTKHTPQPAMMSGRRP